MVGFLDRQYKWLMRQSGMSRNKYLACALPTTSLRFETVGKLTGCYLSTSQSSLLNGMPLRHHVMWHDASSSKIARINARLTRVGKWQHSLAEAACPMVM